MLSLKLTILYDLYIRVFRRKVVDQNGLKTLNISEGVESRKPKVLTICTRRYILQYLVLSNSMYAIIQLYKLIGSLSLSPNHKERRDVLYRIVINRVDSFTLLYNCKVG